MCVCVCVCVCVRVLRGPGRPGRAGLMQSGAGVVAEIGAARVAGIIRGDGGESRAPRSVPTQAQCYLPTNTAVICVKTSRETDT